jgi:mannose-6-phosphate isomerase
MGTYPTMPSLILSSGEDHQKYIYGNKEKLVEKSILIKLGADLPCLLKAYKPTESTPLIK